MNKFTLSVGLNAIKKHFLVSLVLFIVTMLLLTNFNIFDNKYELKKIIVPGVSNDEYKARVLEREHIKSMVSSASIYSSLKSTIDNGEIAKYRVDNKDKSKFIVVNFRGNSVESVFNTANKLIENLQEFDRLEIKHSIDLIDKLLSSKYREIDSLSLINKTPLPSDDTIKLHASMQKVYDKAYNGGTIKNHTPVISNIISLNQKDIQNKVKIANLTVNLNKEIYILEGIIKNGYKMLSYLSPVTKKNIKRYFPNPIVFFGVSLLVVVFYNLIMLNLLFRRCNPPKN